MKNRNQWAKPYRWGMLGPSVKSSRFTSVAQVVILAAPSGSSSVSSMASNLTARRTLTRKRSRRASRSLRTFSSPKNPLVKWFPVASSWIWSQALTYHLNDSKSTTEAHSIRYERDPSATFFLQGSSYLAIPRRWLLVMPIIVNSLRIRSRGSGKSMRSVTRLRASCSSMQSAAVPVQAFLQWYLSVSPMSTMESQSWPFLYTQTVSLKQEPLRTLQSLSPTTPYYTWAS